MLWLIGQITVFLIIAAAIGFLVGWMMRALWPSSSTRVREGELESALERASGRISHLEAGLRAKRVAAAAAAEQEQAALRRVEELEAALATLHSEGKTDTTEVVDLQEELDEAIESIKALRREMSDIQAGTAEIAALRAERDAALERLADLQSGEPLEGGLFLVPDDTAAEESEASEASVSLEWDDEELSVGPTDEEPTEAEAEEEPTEAEAEEEPTEAEAEEEPTEAEAEEEPTEAELEERRLEAAAQVTKQFRLPKGTVPDDLKRIYGIGPVLERVLHGMNIKTFRQIADFSEADIDLVSAALGRAFPGRIRRDDWVGGARELVRKARKW